MPSKWYLFALFFLNVFPLVNHIKQLSRLAAISRFPYSMKYTFVLDAYANAHISRKKESKGKKCMHINTDTRDYGHCIKTYIDRI